MNNTKYVITNITIEFHFKYWHLYPHLTENLDGKFEALNFLFFFIKVTRNWK